MPVKIYFIYIVYCIYTICTQAVFSLELSSATLFRCQQICIKDFNIFKMVNFEISEICIKIVRKFLEKCKLNMYITLKLIFAPHLYSKDGSAYLSSSWIELNREKKRERKITPLIAATTFAWLQGAHALPVDQ